MKRLLWILCTAALAFAFTAIAPNARASRLSDAKGRITFNQPVEVPGHVVLSAGTYWFVAMTNFGSTPDEVLVYNGDRTNLLDRVQTIPAQRKGLVGRERLTFAEQSTGQPLALVSWFDFGRMTGYRFVYSSNTQKQLESDNHVTLNLRPGETATGGLPAAHEEPHRAI